MSDAEILRDFSLTSACVQCVLASVML